MASKIIYLKRGRAFIHEHINSDAMQSQLSQTKRGVGGYFASKSSTKSGTGLTREEEKLIMPLVLSVPVESQDFWLKVDDYYANINTLVPFGKEGLKLEIGLEDNTKLLSSSNMPISLGDYIKYRHALKHPKVAATEELAEGNQLFDYYFEDPSAVVNKQITKLELEDKALADYQQIKTDEKRIDMMLTLLRHYIPKEAGKPPVMINKINKGEKTLHLKKLAQNQPELFHQLAGDEQITKKYKVDELVSIGLIKRVGKVFVDNATNEPLGTSVEEVIAFLWDPKNTQLLSRFITEYKSQKAIPSVLA